MQISKGLHISFHVVVGMLLCGGGWAGAIAFNPDTPPRFASLIIMCLGLLVLGGALLQPGSLMGRISRGICLAIFALFLGLLAIEVVGRIVGFDFGGKEKAQRRLPPFFRAPTVPVPPVFFRRNGPESWTGPVLRRGLELTGHAYASYLDEPEVTINYDDNGFRNEFRQSDWEIAIAGDSFVELGFLRFDQIFTTILGNLTDQAVRNLGVSHTGSLTQLQYLQLYGLAPSTKTLAIVFYEGNDLYDIGGELEALRKFNETGTRDYRTIQKQTSFLGALGEMSPKSREIAPPRINARLTGLANEAELTLTTRLVPEVGLTSLAQSSIGAFLSDFAKFTREMGVGAVIIYMPCKARVLDGFYKWDPPAAELSVGVLPVSLPESIGKMCRHEGIAFIDLTDGLKFKTRETGRLMYNAVQDSHLNAEGSRTVAEVLASKLQPK
jgi:hypothetical protein